MHWYLDTNEEVMGRCQLEYPSNFIKPQGEARTRGMEMILVQVPRRFFSDKAIELLKQVDDVVFLDESKSIPEDIRPDIVAIILPDNPMRQEVLETLPNIKCVSRWGVGYDNVDMEYCKNRGIKVTNTPSCLEDSVADLTYALILNMVRGVHTADKWVRNGKWWLDGKFPLMNDPEDLTLGIVGLGRIGARVEDKTRGKFKEVLSYDVRDVATTTSVCQSLRELIEGSNIVTVHVPLTESTHHMFGLDQLRWMKDNNPSYLVNMARGGVLDTGALKKALLNKWIDGVALDVFEQEPLPMSHWLLRHNSIILTPHIGSATFGSRHRMSMVSAKNTIAILQEKGQYHEVI